MLTRKVNVRSPAGLSLSNCSCIVEQSKMFTADIELRKDHVHARAGSILELLLLNAPQGTELDIVADGDEAEHAVASIAELVEDGCEPEDGTMLVHR